MSAHQYDEGHTVAGWTGFGIATVGTAVLGHVPVLFLTAKDAVRTG
ncbi:hypothetical protein SALBM311S_13045 [Streptomyces alboniger]